MGVCQVKKIINEKPESVSKLLMFETLARVELSAGHNEWVQIEVVPLPSFKQSVLCVVSSVISLGGHPFGWTV